MSFVLSYPDRAVRGGSWWSGTRGARAAYRGASGPSYRLDRLGLRLMRRAA